MVLFNVCWIAPPPPPQTLDFLSAILSYSSKIGEIAKNTFKEFYICNTILFYIPMFAIEANVDTIMMFAVVSQVCLQKLTLL